MEKRKMLRLLRSAKNLIPHMMKVAGITLLNVGRFFSENIPFLLGFCMLTVPSHPSGTAHRLKYKWLLLLSHIHGKISVFMDIVVLIMMT